VSGARGALNGRCSACLVIAVRDIASVCNDAGIMTMAFAPQDGIEAQGNDPCSQGGRVSVSGAPACVAWDAARAHGSLTMPIDGTRSAASASNAKIRRSVFTSSNLSRDACGGRQHSGE